MKIVPYRAEHMPAMAEFNDRLRRAGTKVAFPESSTPVWLPRHGGSPLYQEFFLATDGAAVRGGYILKHQIFQVAGAPIPVGNYQLPLSEGIVDRRYAALGLYLLRDALERQPLLYALGLGGYDEPLVKLLIASGWSLQSVPFYFRVLRPLGFLRQISYLRTSPARQRALDFLALSGLGWVTAKLAHALRARPVGVHAEERSREVAEFGADCDRLWQNVRDGFVFVAVRDRPTLTRLYATSYRPFITIRLEAAGRLQGWAVLLATPLKGHKHFGNMKLGSVVDCLSLPGWEQRLLRAATDRLRAERVDLIVSNQSHHAMGRALTRLGYFRGPSNFLLALSPRLGERLAPLAENYPRMHLNRGDGDGPIHI